MSALAQVVAVGFLILRFWFWCYVPFRSVSAIIVEEYGNDRDDYTKGQIHYLSMDAGMSSCWNHTVKKLLHLACPRLSTNPDLAVELAFILTSCFCMSIGAPHLSCRSPSRRDAEEHYHFSLIDCAIGKCFNKYDNDGFEINYERMPHICFYIVDEAKTNPNEKTLYVGDSELVTLNKIVGGEHFAQFDTKLQVLQGIITEEFQKRQEGIIFWLRAQLSEFWLLVDDVMFKLRIRNYANVPYY